MSLQEDNPSSRVAERYFALLHHELAAGERIEVRLRPASPGSRMRRAFLVDVREAARLAVRLGTENDVYAGAATRFGEDGTKKGVCRVAALWADLDAKEGHTRESRFAQLEGLPCRPSMVVWTGGGWHAYWSLEEPAGSPEEMGRAELAMRRLAAGLGSDPVHDRSRILRVPGTYNHKTGEPRPVALEVFEPGRRYALARLLEMAGSLAGDTDDGTDAGGVVREVLGEPIRENHRNTALASVAGSLRDRGLDAETIRVVLLDVNRLRCAPPLEEREVSGIAGSISRYPAGKPRYRRSPVKRVRKKKEER